MYLPAQAARKAAATALLAVTQVVAEIQLCGDCAGGQPWLYLTITPRSLGVRDLLGVLDLLH